MTTLIDLQKKLYPDLLETMQQRFAVLHSVDLFQPIGRRGLAEHTNLTERVVRSEIDFLHKQGLIHITTKGMHSTKEGKILLEQLANFISEIMGLSGLENQIKDRLQVSNVIIVPGDSDKQEWVKQEMGKACVSYLKKIVQPDFTIAVTGGTTMAAVAEVMTPLDKEGSYLFVPARGGIGEKVENQANTIVSEMARKTNGEYRLLYVPDPLSETAYQTIINEPTVNDTIQQIKSANIVMHGIGDALKMAERRKTSETLLHELKKKQAASETFGYYFDKHGNIVHKVRTVGIHLEDLVNINHVITVAGGTSKGQAIESYFKQGKTDVLITDEAAATQLLRETSL